jgi:hypothetical protein
LRRENWEKYEKIERDLVRIRVVRIMRIDEINIKKEI